MVGTETQEWENKKTIYFMIRFSISFPFARHTQPCNLKATLTNYMVNLLSLQKRHHEIY